MVVLNKLRYKEDIFDIGLVQLKFNPAAAIICFKLVLKWNIKYPTCLVDICYIQSRFKHLVYNTEASAIANIGIAYAQMGVYKAAAEYLEIAINTLKYTSPEAVLAYATAKFFLGQEELSMKILERGHIMFKDDAEIQLA